ncbi:MAG: hypothetical protein HRT89_17630, partial [Lentisphaeria bacterium]|nr:hypothetical protein [Lentisphaeria bacterium]
LPFTSELDEQAQSMVSLLLRPIVCPEIPNFMQSKNMEIRLFAPGSLVSNLDFVESIFGNSGDPNITTNDAALDAKHWNGHTGFVILAPQIGKLTKKELGLPNVKDANERQTSDGMYWEDENELYNDGNSFKVTYRSDEGIVLTIISDNYFGYCKKEVKTMISYSANLFGLCEEEHAGGTLAFPAFNLGDTFMPQSEAVRRETHTYDEALAILGDRANPQDEGYAIDTLYESIIYIQETAIIDLPSQSVTWTHNDTEQTLKLLPKHTYIHPSGFKVKMEKHPGAPSYRLVGSQPKGTLCHKPCTVSGGGKSEISKSLNDALIYGPFFVANIEKDIALINEIMNKDYGERFRVMRPKERESRSINSPGRSLGSVIKLLTPSEQIYSDDYNEWLESIPHFIKALVFIIKRFYRPHWGDDWQKYFSVDVIDGQSGHELKYKNRKLVAAYLRIGYSGESAWNTFKLRQDFMPAEKIQFEDDITSSVTIPATLLKDSNPHYKNPSVKLVENCEFRLFQRPDEAINPGMDLQAESDVASHDIFLSNYAPLPVEKAREMVSDTLLFGKFTEPMQKFLLNAAAQETGYFACTNSPRIVNGEPT